MNVESPLLIRPAARICHGVAAALCYALRIDSRPIPAAWRRLLARLDGAASSR